MVKTNHTKKERKFTKKMQIKLLAVFAVILVFLVILLLRIAQINVESGQKYAKQVLSQENYDSRTIYSRRGEIQDANGRTMAYSEKQYNVVLDCSAVNYYDDLEDYEEYVEATVESLSDVFGLDEDALEDLIKDEKTRNSQYQVLLSNVTEEQKDEYEEYISLEGKELSDKERSRLQKIVEVWFEETFIRRYPMDSVASSVIGFANSIGDGVTGLEAYYDEMLQGTDGRVYGYLNENQEFQRRTIAPENGYTLQMTIDVNIQQIVEKYIAEFDEEYGDEKDDGTAKHGAANIGVVAMDPNSGAILAMATNSGYNLNKPEEVISDWYTPSEKKAMTPSDYVEALNNIWSNFCVTDSFEPGSTVKPITIASALECGAITSSSSFYCDGSELVTDTTIKCDNIYGHGAETVGDAIKNSCNDALMAVGAAMGVSQFIEYQSLFNFGKKTGIDLPNESAGVVYSRENMNEVELATCSFGQGFTCTMVQEIAAFSSVVNGGYYYQPHVVDKILDSDGKVVQSMDNLLRKQTISTEVSDLLKQYLMTAVQEGTGRSAQVPGYLIGGKTGTAEKINPDTKRRWAGHYLVSFIGAAPIYDPEIVIYVVVDEPNVADQAVSTYAQVLYRKIATEVLPYMNIYPTEEVSDDVLESLGLSRADIASETRQTFQAFDSYGNLYNDAYVDEDNIVVSGDGSPLAGAYIDASGNVIDGYGNAVAQVDSVVSEEKVTNPDMAVPPDENTDSGEDTTLWEPSVLPEEDAEE